MDYSRRKTDRRRRALLALADLVVALLMLLAGLLLAYDLYETAIFLYHTFR